MLSEKRLTVEATLRLLAWLLSGVCAMVLLSAAILHAAGIEDTQSPAAVLLGAFSVHGTALALVIIFLRVERLSMRDAFGVSSNGAWRAVFFGIAGAAVFIPVGYGLQAVSEWLMTLAHHASAPEESVQILSENRVWWVRSFLVAWAVIVAPVAEEIGFRGLLYPLIKRLGYPAAAFWGTSLLFGAIHFNVAAFVPLTVFAMLLAWLYERTDTLLAPIAAHGFFNAASLVFLLVQEHGWLDKPHLGQ